MDSKKAGAIIIIAMVIVSAGLLLLTPVPEEEIILENEDVAIALDPFNRLNWWDIAWNLSEPYHFVDAINQLQQYGPRVANTPGHDNAVAYFEEQFEIIGTPTSKWGFHESLVGYQEGYGSDNRAIVFGAHIDTWNLARATLASGINQNAAGCSAVMMIAQTLVQFRLPIDIYYCFYEAGHDAIFANDGVNPELYQMWGSIEVVDKFLDDETEIIASYNFDDLLYIHPQTPDAPRFHVEYDIGSYSQTKYLADIFSSFMQNEGDNLIDPILERATDSDHRTFWRQGLPAVNVKTGHPSPDDFYVWPNYDNINNPAYDLELAPLVARAGAATALYLGLQGNGAPTVFKLDRDIVAETTSSIYTSITNAQIIDIYGTVQEGSVLIVEIGNGTMSYVVRQISGTFSFPVEVTQRGPLVATVYNANNESVSVDMYLEYQSDIDGNGVYDSEQYTWSTPDPIIDWDHDSLSDVDEVIAGTDIFSFDTDEDSISDGVEVRLGLDPLLHDSEGDYDADEITNIMEIHYGTDPLSNDSDSDLMSDTWEIQFHTDPLVDDAATDYDNDGLTTLEEYYFGSDPLSTDGDFDGLSDIEEYALGTNPLNEDSDSDGLRDNLEVLEGLDPLGVDYDFDLGFDGADANPRINLLLTMGFMILAPTFIGYFFLRRRLYK
ncbi:MAG: M28 family peptidase [Candidatus Thorarchaeota archaeon]